MTAQRTATRVRRLTDPREILAALQADRLYAAYAIGNLEAARFQATEWYGASSNGSQAFFEHCRGFEPNACFILGEPAALGELLAGTPRPWCLQFSCRFEHLAVLEEHYRLERIHTMVRMVVDRAGFRRASGDALRLRGMHLPELMRLYASGGGYVFTPDQLEEGIYYGIWRSGTVVAVAGTHFVTPGYGLAAVGNVYTHPLHRNRGYARACTAAVTADLLDGCPEVVLNVRADNASARRAYEQVGFRDYCTYVEALGTRRSGQIKDFLAHLWRR